MKGIQKYITEHPLASILWLAFLARIVAVIFSKGYGFSDDHFSVIEVAQSWVDGLDINYWLPGAHNPNAEPGGRVLFYVGANYYVLLFLKFIGIHSPEAKMLVIRLLHALLSLVVVKYAYKITEKLSTKENALTVGLLCALLWFMPMLSVRNLVEMACIPPLIYGTWLLVNNEQGKAMLFLWAGFIAGLAFSIRFQTSTFLLGMGLAVLVRQKFAAACWFALGVMLSIAGIQCAIDYAVWGKPFAEFLAYTNYNMAHANDYITGPWYNYFLLLGGILIPPVSLFLLFGFGRSYKKMLLIFLPSLLFFIFHSSFPNKQERFILPLVPFVIIAGVCGWNEFVAQSKYWQTQKSFLLKSWIFFWVLNTLLLLLLTPSSSKISRVDAMSYLGEKKDTRAFILETSNSDDIILMPRYYMGEWKEYYKVRKSYTIDMLAADLNKDTSMLRPNYLILGEPLNKEVRLHDVEEYFEDVTYETTIESGYLDRLMHWLNPYGNENQTYFIYKLGALKKPETMKYN